MTPSDGRKEDLVLTASLGGHLAFAPVAFAVAEGDAHTLVYANTLFQNLQSGGWICIGGDRPTTPDETVADLTPLLNEVRRSGTAVRDAVLESRTSGAVWSCSIWPTTSPNDASDMPSRLVIEVRDAGLISAAMERQRAIAEQLLLGALREQDAAREAAGASERSEYLAAASRELSLSLDEHATRDTVRRLALPRPGSWCIVDVVESNGGIHRLAVLHPDPAKQALAHLLEEQWPHGTRKSVEAMSGLRALLNTGAPTVITSDSGAALTIAACGEANLQILQDIGFGSLLMVPLIVRARVQGAITFISQEGDPPFSPDEIALAVDLATRCAMALDNARLYRETDALRLAAEAANQSKSEFLGNMSHELRTPLNAIGGFAELIELGIEGPVTARQQGALARIKANQRHLLTLITEILNFVRIESGRMEYRIGPVSLASAAADVVQMLSEAASQKNLVLESLLADRNVVAFADPDRVRQILVNLVMNAVKYTPTDGGTITLTHAVAGDRAMVSVTDTGPGIPSEQLQSIFEPFVQLPSNLTDRRGGIGLGLPISRDLARAMNGDITVESTLGVGSRFILTLPRVR